MLDKHSTIELHLQSQYPNHLSLKQENFLLVGTGDGLKCSYNMDLNSDLSAFHIPNASMSAHIQQL